MKVWSSQNACSRLLRRCGGPDARRDRLRAVSLRVILFGKAQGKHTGAEQFAPSVLLPWNWRLQTAINAEIKSGRFVRALEGFRAATRPVRGGCVSPSQKLIKVIGPRR